MRRERGFLFKHVKMNTEIGHVTLQDLLKENFSISSNTDIKNRTTGDMNDILFLIQQGQQRITAAAQDREEAHDSEKVKQI